MSTYYETKPRKKIYNVLSFEISKTKLNKIIKLPSIVLQLSWAFSDISRLAVKDSINSGSIQNFAEPAVHKYCLISAANSFTDFHIDFGGSSVWYHVVKVNKFIIRENLYLFELLTFYNYKGRKNILFDRANSKKSKYLWGMVYFKK